MSFVAECPKIYLIYSIHTIVWYLDIHVPAVLLRLESAMVIKVGSGCSGDLGMQMGGWSMARERQDTGMPKQLQIWGPRIVSKD